MHKNIKNKGAGFVQAASCTAAEISLNMIMDQL